MSLWDELEKKGEGLKTILAKTLMIQDDDIKSRKIKKALIGEVDVIPLGGSPFLYLFRYVVFCIRFEVPTVYVVRYLNDYPGFLKSLLITILEILMLRLMCLMKVKVAWICHNVNRESSENYPLLISLRRRNVLSLSSTNFVTDYHLTPHFRRKYGPVHVDFITFGNLDDDKGRGSQGDYSEKMNAFHETLKCFVEEKKSESNLQGRKPFFTLCAGRANSKTHHFFRILDLVESFGKSGFDLYVVMVGDIKPYLKASFSQVNLVSKIESHSNILFFKEHIEFSTSSVSQYFDFYWRVYSDFSTPTTLYSAAFEGKPLVTLKMGFLYELIRLYKLGFVLKDDMTNINECVEFLDNWDSSVYEPFLKDRSWTVAAKKMKKLVYDR